MTQLDKLREKVRNNPRQVAMGDIDKLLRAAGYDCRDARSNHRYYTRTGSPPISVPYRRPHVKETYVRQVLAILDEMDA